MKPTASLVVAALAALALPSTGQTTCPAFSPAERSYLPLHRMRVGALAVGDVDGDGDLDLLLGARKQNPSNPEGQNRLFLNEGQGRFLEAPPGSLPLANDDTCALALGDLDGDGDLDLVVGNKGLDVLCFNDGKGRFTDATAGNLPVQWGETGALALGDVDRDGDLDLLVGDRDRGNQRPNLLFLNDGWGTFKAAPTGMLPSADLETTCLALGDLDKDGDPDLVVGDTSWGDINLYLNDGLGTFNALGGQIPAIKGHNQAALLADVDGDGDLDLVMGRLGQENLLFLNDGKARFTQAPAGALPALQEWTFALAAGDLDGDKDIDIIVGNTGQYVTSAEANTLLLNDGKGTFLAAPGGRLPRFLVPTRALALGDLDGDGDLDLLEGDEDGCRSFLNAGGRFVDGAAAFLPHRGDANTCFAAGDLDGDGDQDLVAGNTNDQVLLYRNDGRGALEDATPGRLPLGKLAVEILLLGDVDGDGDLDLLAGTAGKAYLLLNDGSATFLDATSSRLPPSGAKGSSLALGDVDGDGDLDLAAPSPATTRHVMLLLNDGLGFFADGTQGRLPAFFNNQGHLAFLDVDRDGDSDLFIGRSNNQSRLYINNGQGVFTDQTLTRLPARQDQIGRLAAGDLDGDGAPEIAFAGYPKPLLYMNDGKGVFLEESQGRFPALEMGASAIAMGDIDEDGDRDLIVGLYMENKTGGQNRLWLNDGMGGFLDISGDSMPRIDDSTSALALADMDGDGDLDLIVGNDSTTTGFDRDFLHLNTLRQVRAPIFAWLGREYAVEIQARTPRDAVALLALPLLAAATGRLEIPPFGTFGLDAAALVGLPVLYTNPSLGRAEMRLPVPPEPSLEGASIYLQALVEGRQGKTATWRLTNVWAERLLRL